WHLFDELGLTKARTKRIVFHEITKPAILKAIENPRDINENLVNAQQARRILDRLVGFELSPILWRKIKPSLSAGRVQSVAVRLIVEKERDIRDFDSTPYYKVSAIFDIPSGDKFVPLKAELPKKFQSQQEAEEFLGKCKDSNFSISNLETKPSKKSPAAPFITSTLQQEASRKLFFSVSKTMMIAQRLYESGKITYMRTDSVTLSDTALESAKEEITSVYGQQYSETRQFTNKSKGAQEAHEAIRPTYFKNHTVDGENDEQRLYELIWKRAIASQMSNAQLEKTTATIVITNSEETLVAKGEVIKFDGFLKVYLESLDEEDLRNNEESAMLPPLSVGQMLQLNNINAVERFSHPPSRFTEASLVKKLEELGIGRPSTYAPTISTIQKRGYVEKGIGEGTERQYKVFTLQNGIISNEVKIEKTGADKGKLIPTDIGMVVNDFLVEHFENVMDYNFTASVEKEFDDISMGNKAWNEMIAEFYTPFHKNVEITLETSERATGERELGVDPKSGKRIIARVGRYGPMVQIGEADDEEKPRFAAIRSGQRIDTITLEEALHLFELPRSIGEFENTEITVNIGRFGPYVKHMDKFYSLKGDVDDPYTIEKERAIEVIHEKRKLESERIIKTFDENEEVKVLKGRWGPYIAVGKQNVKIPKDTEPSSLTLEECLKLAEEAPKTKGKGKSKRKAKK
ncbi:type I DNA topoisomerase, partial [Sphingobacteriaceae bacterium AH-315-L07]|nr:type I DNA topoisomerase [Sphingobacteriaceae bacterium AH-315-L07]